MGEPDPNLYVHYRTPKGSMLHSQADKTSIRATAREERITCPMCLACIDAYAPRPVAR